jgi:hypothetical protein
MPTTNSIITITTQRDLDEALERRIEKAYLAPDASVIIHAGSIRLLADSGRPCVEARGTSSPHVEARGTSRPYVVARGTSRPYVVARNTSTPYVVARDTSSPHVVARGTSSPYVAAQDTSSPYVMARDTSSPHVAACDASSPRVEAFGKRRPCVEAWGSWIGPCPVPIVWKNRDDLCKVLAARPNEVEGLRRELVAGHVDGSCYEGGCSCLLGTLSRCAGVPVDALGIHRDPSRPAEALFAPIRPGMTPENCPLVAVIVGWIDQWLAANKSPTT